MKLSSKYSRHPFLLEPLQVAIAMQEANEKRYEQIERDTDSSNADLQQNSLNWKVWKVLDSRDCQAGFPLPS